MNFVKFSFIHQDTFHGTFHGQDITEHLIQLCVCPYKLPSAKYKTHKIAVYGVYIPYGH